MADLLRGDAFFTHPRPRRRCEDCGSAALSWGTVDDVRLLVDADVFEGFQRFCVPGSSVYWCSCGLVGAFTPSFIG